MTFLRMLGYGVISSILVGAFVLFVLTVAKRQPQRMTQVHEQNAELIAYDLWRVEAPGGWVVYTYRGGVTFVSDAEHTWELKKQ